METVQGPEAIPLSHEGKSLSRLDWIRLQMHLSCLKVAYLNVSNSNESLNLEEIALSSLRIENFNTSIKSIRTSIFAESESAWQMVCQKRHEQERRVFRQTGDETLAFELRSPALAREIADAWEKFSRAISDDKKHLVSLDELLNLIKYEGSSTRIDKLSSTAAMLAAQFLAGNPQKNVLMELWLKISRIRDRNTIIARFDDLINAMPDLAVVSTRLIDYANTRKASWSEKAEKMAGRLTEEKLFFQQGYQGTRESRDQLRFAMTCRRYELTQEARLRRNLERIIRQRQQDENRRREQLFRTTSGRSRSRHDASSITPPPSPKEHLKNHSFSNIFNDSKPFCTEDNLTDTKTQSEPIKVETPALKHSQPAAEPEVAEIDPTEKVYFTPEERREFIAEHYHAIETFYRDVPEAQSLTVEEICSHITDYLLLLAVSIGYQKVNDAKQLQMEEDKRLQKSDSNPHQPAQAVPPISPEAQLVVQSAQITSHEASDPIPASHLTKRQRHKLLAERTAQIKRAVRKKTSGKPPD